MAAVGMLRSRRRRSATIDPLVADFTFWVRAPISGILHMVSPLGGRVAKSSRIGVIAEPFGGQELGTRSPVSGMVIGRLNLNGARPCQCISISGCISEVAAR
jgi:predicted deacylase